MRVVLSGGGTAGHINPALALAEELDARGHEILFAGTPQGVEAKLVAEAGIPYKGFEASGFNRSHPTSIISALFKIQASTRKAKQWFSEIEPDVVVGFGGYVSIPVGRAAIACDIPLVIHEQNSVAGLANKHLAKHASAVALTYETTSDHFKASDTLIVTGNPVRTSVRNATRQQGRELFGIPPDARFLLVFGGSLGARHINQAISDLKEQLLAYEDLYVMHVTGPKEFDNVVKSLSLTPEEQTRWNVCAYQNNMGEALAAADVVVSRAGATSLAEIATCKTPALLVPYPYATEDHQTTNAQSYVEGGAALMVADDQVETAVFADALFPLIEDGELRQSMRDAAASLKAQDAGARLADVVIAVAAR